LSVLPECKYSFGNTPSPRPGNLSNVIWRKKVKRGKRKMEGNMREKGKKSKDIGIIEVKRVK
jgi:hypothetical protein